MKIIAKNGLTLLLLFFCYSSYAQRDAFWTTFDTLKVFPDSVYVSFEIFEDSFLTERSSAWLYPTKIKVPRYSFFQGIFRTTIEADSVVYHGNRTSFLENGKYKEEKYERGELLSSHYRSAKGEVLTQEEYNKSINLRGPCVDNVQRFFIRGVAKREGRLIKR